MRESRLSRAVGAAAALLVLGFGTNALAQDGFNVLQFNPQPSQATNYFETASARVLAHLAWEAGLLMEVVDDPLVLVDANGERVASVIETQIVANFLVSVGIADRAEVGIDVPFVAYQTGPESLPVNNMEPIDGGGGVGDIRLVPKIQLVSTLNETDSGGMALAFIGDIFLPTGDEESYQGSSFGFHTGFAFEYLFQTMASVVANVGYRYRDGATVDNIQVDDTITWGIAADINVIEELHIVPEIVGEISIAADEAESDDMPMEWLLGAKYFIGEEFMLQGGLGSGLLHGFGTPDWRIFAGVSYSPGDAVSGERSSNE